LNLLDTRKVVVTSGNLSRLILILRCSSVETTVLPHRNVDFSTFSCHLQG
jgi:hypothetical protein